MDGALLSLETLAPIEALRYSRWAYAAVNTAHVFAIALLVGGVVPLSLRLMGLWSAVPRAGIVRILSLSTGFGLGLALISGSVLFATRASEYAGNPALQIKLVLVLLGAASAVLAHARHGWDLAGAPDGTARRAAVISGLCWIGALIAGRLIAFLQG